MTLLGSPLDRAHGMARGQAVQRELHVGRPHRVAVPTQHFGCQGSIRYALASARLRSKPNGPQWQCLTLTALDGATAPDSVDR